MPAVRIRPPRPFPRSCRRGRRKRFSPATLADLGGVVGNVLKIVGMAGRAADRPDLRRILTEGLKGIYEVVEAATGAALLLLCATQPAPACILLVDADATAMLASVDATGGPLPVPVVVVADRPERVRVRALLQAGATEVVAESGLTAQSLDQAIETAQERFALAADKARAQVPPHQPQPGVSE